MQIYQSSVNKRGNVPNSFRDRLKVGHDALNVAMVVRIHLSEYISPNFWE